MSRHPDKVAVVVDELPLVRRGLADLMAGLGIEVVSSTSTARAGLIEARALSPALVVIGAIGDVEIDDAALQARRTCATARVLVLLATPSRAVCQRLLSLQVDGILRRSAADETVIAALRRLLAGERVIDPSIAPLLLGSLADESGTDPADASAPGPSATGPSPLTPREQAVLVGLAAGLSNQEIAARLYVSVTTVKTHLGHIYEKLRVTDRRQAIERALASGLLR